MLGDLAPGGEVGMPVGVAELLRGLPGDVDLDVLLALRERGIEPGLLPVGESFLPGAEAWLLCGRAVPAHRPPATVTC